MAQVVEMGSLGDVQSALAAQVEEMRTRTAAQEDGYCATIAELQEQVRQSRYRLCWNCTAACRNS